MTDDPIAAINDVHLEAIKKEDVASLVKDLEDGVIWMPPAETNLYGKQEVEEWWTEYFEFFTIAQLETTERALEIVGDIALERTSWSLKLVPKKAGPPSTTRAAFSRSGASKPTAVGRCGSGSGTASNPSEPERIGSWCDSFSAATISLSFLRIAD